ncbi:MAG TPA: VirB3 family type IV secretion system protein [Bryobacteraceae bacterium]|jgi:type IV secretory pathway TrbD component
MSNQPLFHPVYRSINKPLTVWGAERRLFFLAAIMGAATFNFFGSLLGGLIMFIALFLLARWATATDAEILRILLNAAQFRTLYDPAKRDPTSERGLRS